MTASHTERRQARVSPLRYQFNWPTREVIDIMAKMSIDNQWRVTQMVSRFFDLCPCPGRVFGAPSSGQRRASSPPHLRLVPPPRPE